jgi:hypothetical protein
MADAALSRDPPEPPGNGDDHEWGVLAADVEELNQRLRRLSGQVEWAVDPDPEVLSEIAGTLREAIQLVEDALEKHKPPSPTARRKDPGANPASAFLELKPRGRTVYASVHVLLTSVVHRTASKEQMAKGTTGDLTEQETIFQTERERVVSLLERFLDDWEDFVKGPTRA